MKKVFMLLVLGLSCLCIQAQTSQPVYETQLEQLKTNLKNYPVKLDSYTNKGVIGTNEKLKALKTQLLSDMDSYFPTGDNDGKFFFWNFQEMQTALGEATTKEMKKLLAEQLAKNLDAEMQVVELTWKLDGLTYKTQCVVPDAGIVYDNLIANMACYQKREVSVK